MGGDDIMVSSGSGGKLYGITHQKNSVDAGIGGGKVRKKPCAYRRGGQKKGEKDPRCM